MYLFFFFIGISSAQNNNSIKQFKIDPPQPIVDRVSVNSSTGAVEIFWSLDSDIDVDGFVIQEEINGSSFPQITVNDPKATSHIFEYSRANDVSVGLNVFSFIGKDQSEFSEPTHFTILTSLEIDTCNQGILITWSPYIGWGENLSGYSIFQLVNNIPVLIHNQTRSSSNQFLFRNVKESEEYCFYVNANRSSFGLPSTSKKKCIIIPQLTPSFIIGRSTISSNNDIEISFEVDKDFKMGSYKLFRSEFGKNNFILVSEITSFSNGIVKYVDEFRGKIYDYKLVYTNPCKDTTSFSSNSINNILLKGRSEANTNHLSWNSFSSWAEGTKEVNVYRSTSAGNFELLQTFISPSQTEYADVINAESQITGDICYRVEAVSGSEKDTSKSNVFCVNMLGEIFVPTAFTPNDDGANDEIRPTFSILPTKYIFSVYNRYGSKIFETNNISEGWDGRLPDGKKALEGTYIYFVKIENGAGKVLEKRGNFSVIYP